MPISATGSKGFTLIELMVVLAILGLASAAVVFALPSGDGSLRQDAERFAARVTAARDLAVVNARPVRVMVTAAGYGFAERRSGAWVAVPVKAMQDVRWKAGTTVTGQTSVTFDPTGMVSAPLALTLARGDVGARVDLDGSGAAHVAP